MNTMKRVNITDYEQLPADYRGHWTTERHDIDVFHYMGRQTLLTNENGGTVLLIEGIHFVLVENRIPAKLLEYFDVLISDSGSRFDPLTIWYRATITRLKGRGKKVVTLRFATAAARTRYISTWAQWELKTIQDNEQSANHSAKAVARFIEANGLPFKVGQIMYNTWGYDQTNVDFFQVVAATAKSVTLQPITDQRTPNDKRMAGKATPCPNQFKGEPFRRVIKTLHRPNGKIEFRISNAEPWNGTPVNYTCYA